MEKCFSDVLYHVTLSLITIKEYREAFNKPLGFQKNQNRTFDKDKLIKFSCFYVSFLCHEINVNA